jgi:hypothetical protein
MYHVERKIEELLYEVKFFRLSYWAMACEARCIPSHDPSFGICLMFMEWFRFSSPD